MHSNIGNKPAVSHDSACDDTEHINDKIIKNRTDPNNMYRYSYISMWQNPIIINYLIIIIQLLLIINY